MKPIIPTLSEEQRAEFYRTIEVSLVAAAPAPLVPYPGPEPSPPRIERFDGAAAWSRLEPQAQAAIGGAALELVIAREGMDASRDMREERIFEAAEREANAHLEERAMEHMLDVGAIPPDQVPGIPSLLGPICRECGCTDHDACWTPPRGDGCSWVEPELCSACAAGAQVRPRTAPAPDARTGA